MADGVFNISKGRVSEYATRILGNDPAASIFTAHLWEGTDITDAAMRDLATVAAIEATTLIEASFTNYASFDITDTVGSLVVATDQANDRTEVDAADITWTAAGNGANDTLVRMTISYDAAGTHVDSGVLPCTFYDFDVLTDGSDLTAQFDAAGFYRAA